MTEILRFTHENCIQIFNDLKEIFKRNGFPLIIDYEAIAILSTDDAEPNDYLVYSLYWVSLMSKGPALPKPSDIADSISRSEYNKIMVIICRIYGKIYNQTQEMVDFLDKHHIDVSDGEVVLYNRPRTMLHCMEDLYQKNFAERNNNYFGRQQEKVCAMMKKLTKRNVELESALRMKNVDNAMNIGKTRRTVRQTTLLEFVQQAREYAHNDCTPNDIHTLQAFLHRLDLSPQLRKLVQSITAKDDKWERLIAAIEKPKINIERVNDIHDNDNVKAGL